MKLGLKLKMDNVLWLIYLSLLLLPLNLQIAELKGSSQIKSGHESKIAS